VNDLTREQILLGDAFLNTLVPNPFVGLMPDAGATNTAAMVQRRVLMRPLPQFGTINEQLVPIGYGNYKSIQVSWEKRLSHGVQFLVGYTGSRTEASTHRPHVLRLSGGWTTPAFQGRNWALRHLLGDWQINTVTFFRSGVPVAMSGNVDLIGDPVLDNPTTARWFNTCTLTTAGARQGCANDSEQPAFQIRAENALDTTGDRLEGVMQDEPF
jgi:hypothetical protein